MHFFLVVRSIVSTIRTSPPFFPKEGFNTTTIWLYEWEGPVYDTGPGSLWAYAQILNSMLQSRDGGELFRRLAWADMNSPDHELSGYFGWGFGTSTPFWLRQRIAFRSDTFFGTRTLTIVRFREDADRADA